MFNLNPRVYPTNAIALRARLLQEAANPPLKHAALFFRDHFANGGGIVHPLLGDLELFANQIDAQWNVNHPKAGVNLVSCLIRGQVQALQAAENARGLDIAQAF